MTQHALALPALLAVALSPGSARAWDPFDDAEAPPHFELTDGDLSLALKGELSLGFHDLEGEGGPGKDSSTDTRTIGTRSPYFELGGFTLAPRLQITPRVAVNTQLRFTPDDTTLAATWFDSRGRWGPIDLHVELGYRPPFVARDPHAIREPLAGTIFTSAPEMHLTSEVGQTFGPDDALSWSAGVSAAMGRPLGFAPIQASRAQRGTINVLAYDPGRVYSGNAPMFGARACFGAYGAFVEAFGFQGELAGEAGTDELRASLAGYGSRPGATKDRTSRWYGARTGYDGLGVHVVAEAIAGAEGVLRRTAADVEAGYRFDLHDGQWYTTLEPFVRYDVYRIEDATAVHDGQALRSPALSQAATWDWTIVTFGLGTALLRDLLLLRVEYDLISEDNGVPALGESSVAFKNNELRGELRLRF